MGVVCASMPVWTEKSNEQMEIGSGVTSIWIETGAPQHLLDSHLLVRSDAPSTLVQCKRSTQSAAACRHTN
jgi:hypothetical protein